MFKLIIAFVIIYLALFIFADFVMWHINF